MESEVTNRGQTSANGTIMNNKYTTMGLPTLDGHYCRISQLNVTATETEWYSRPLVIFWINKTFQMAR